MKRVPPLWGLVLGLAVLISPLLAALDSHWLPLFFRLRGARSAPPDPVLLAIDAESLSLEELLAPAERRRSPLWREMGPWPWPRALQAELAAAVLERGARQVVFNIVLAGPSRFGAADDAAFARRLAPWRQRVVLATAYLRHGPGELEQVELQKPWPAFPRQGLTALLQGPQGLVEAIPGQAWIARNLAGFPAPHPLPLAFAAADRSPPAQPLGIDFSGPAETLPQVPAWQVLQQPPGFWRDRTVLIGATAPDLGDLQETAFGPQSGAQVQLAALATVLRGGGFHALPLPLSLPLALAWALLAALLLRRGRQAGVTAAISLGLAAAALLAGWLLWAQLRLLLPITALVALPLAGGGTRVCGQGLQEGRERRYLQDLLARRVSPTLLRDILREPGPVWTQVGGSRARCAVLFADLVDFTPLSAQLEPAALFALLNRYFEAIAAAVIAEEGLLDKFIGDALMAEFGVPRSRGDRVEALAAVRAALAMRSGLAALNAELTAAGSPPLRQGIGLHFGEVMAGNLGSSQRLEFTVIGAHVNVASRLEGLTRRFPDTPILITGAVLELLPGLLEVVPLGCHALKGLPEPLEVYGLLGLREEAAGER